MKKQIKKVISWCLILATVALLAFLPMIASTEETADGPQASILSAEAECRDISTRILGGGALICEESVAVTIPEAVRLTEYLVENGQTVSAGDPVATVDRVSVMTAITQVQEAMTELKEQIQDTRSDTAPTQISATAGGTVKLLYAAAGDDVRDVMLEHGALAVLSLDGLMAVQVQRNTALCAGDEVCVTFTDGTEVAGQVESNLDGLLTVTVADEGYAVGQEVKLTTDDGDRIGSGQLYIHNPWNVVAYSGTVSRVRVSEGATVTAGRVLFNLSDTGHSTEFESLTRQHREYEALMLELFQLYQSQVLTAPADGMITGVDEAGAYMLRDAGEGATVSLLANAPNGDDESSYVNYVGQVTGVGIDGLVLKLNPQPLSVTDYADLSSVPLDTALMTAEGIYAASAPVYARSGEEWVQLDPATIAAGDILLFAGDEAGNFVWVIKIGSSQPEETPTEPSDPTDPTESTEPTTPQSPGQGGSSGSYPGSGSAAGMTGIPVPETETQLYSLATVTVASVTPQQTVTVEITVDELDISKIYTGQQADVTVGPLTGEKFTATVTSISASGVNEGGNSKFTVTLTLDKTADMLPGMSASVSITTGREENLCIPVAALNGAGNALQVYLGYDEETDTLTDPVDVTTGASDGESVQILSGLEPGQTVYYAYFDTLDISFTPESAGFSFG